MDPLIGFAAKVIADAERQPRKAIRKQETKPVIPWYTRLRFWWTNQLDLWKL